MLRLLMYLNNYDCRLRLLNYIDNKSSKLRLLININNIMDVEVINLY